MFVGYHLKPHVTVDYRNAYVTYIYALFIHVCVLDYDDDVIGDISQFLMKRLQIM